MSLGYRLSRRVSREFDAVIDFRRQVAGDDHAQALEADLITAFGLVASHPRIGPRRPDLTKRPYRFWLKEGYRIVYRLRGARPAPLIVAIIDARRDLARLLR